MCIFALRIRRKAVIHHPGSEVPAILGGVSVLVNGKTKSDSRLTFQVLSDPLHEVSDTAVELLFPALDNSPQLFKRTDEITMHDLVNVFTPILSLASSFVRAVILAE